MRIGSWSWPGQMLVHVRGRAASRLRELSLVQPFDVPHLDGGLDDEHAVPLDPYLLRRLDAGHLGVFSEMGLLHHFLSASRFLVVRASHGEKPAGTVEVQLDVA